MTKNKAKKSGHENEKKRTKIEKNANNAQKVNTKNSLKNVHIFQNKDTNPARPLNHLLTKYIGNVCKFFFDIFFLER